MAKKRVMAAIISCCIVLLTGCGQAREPAQVSFAPYERKVYTTCVVKVGDLQTVQEEVIPAQPRLAISYRTEYVELTDATIFVSEGQKVKKGDLLVEFTSAELEGQIEEYQKQIKEKTLALKHSEEQDKIAGGEYAEEVARQKQELEVARLYLKQAREKKKKARIYARKSGRIDTITSALKTGEFTKESVLIREVCSEQREEQVITKEGPVLKNVVYLERDAVHVGDKGKFVYKLDNEGRSHVVWITTGEKTGEQIVVTEGLSGGEIVAK